MKLTTSAILALTLVSATFLVAAQTPNINDLESTPREIVEQLWSMATRGDLLTTAGWTRASGLFTKPTPPPGNKIISVMSNSYAIARAAIKGNSAEVNVDLEKLGQIDSELRFTIAPPLKVYKTGTQYRLVTGHRHILMYGPDGKTLMQDKEILESRIWQIEGSQGLPWTTVNTAIRYVLEQKAKATNPAAKKNADETLAQLLKLH